MQAFPRYVYIANYLKETVTDSQIVNWLELIDRLGVKFDFMLVTGVKFFLKNIKLHKSKIEELKQKLSGKTYQFCLFKKGAVFGQFMLFTILFFIFLKDILCHRIIVIQTRSSENIVALKWLKSLYPRLKLIFDSRGAIAEEFLMSLNRSPVRSDSNHLEIYSKILRREINFINLSDKLFCVSKKLKQYLLDRNSQLREDKVVVVPSCADQNNFFWDKDARKRLRCEMGIDKKFVLVYSGMLDKAWQKPKFLFFLYSELRKHYSGLFLLCLTPHKYIVDTCLREFNIYKGEAWSNYIPYDDLNDYLCAADAGFLLREDTIINNVASPTKFAEYVMSGLPVIISDKVGDFSEFVREKRIGMIINNNEDINKVVEGFKINLLNSEFDRDEISKIGKNYFSKQAYLEKITSVYEELSEA